MSKSNGATVPSLMVFTSLTAALRAGYQIVDRTPEGYVVRAKTAAGWALALVRCA